MFRSTFALIAALLIGNTAASAATPPASAARLQDRLEAAQKTINNLIDGQPSTTEIGTQVAQHWHNHHWNNWHNHWNNWANHWHNHHRH